MMVAAAVVVFIMARHGRIGAQPSGASLNADDISQALLPDGSHFVSDKTGGYSFVLPPSWYLENKKGSGVAVYPDYRPEASSSPECKIEVSLFRDIPAADMDHWLAAHLSEDPTIAVAEISSEGLSVSGADAALEWKGTMDGVATTLAYVAAEGNIYEIAPSVLDIRKADGNAVCDAALTQFINGMHFENGTK